MQRDDIVLLGVTPDGRLFGEDVEGRRFWVPHPLLGRRVRSPHSAQDGTIEKVEPTRGGYDIIRVVWDDGTRSTETTQGDTILDLELLPEQEAAGALPPRRRGRRPTGKALTPAERNQRRRERLAWKRGWLEMHVRVHPDDRWALRQFVEGLWEARGLPVPEKPAPVRGKRQS